MAAKMLIVDDSSIIRRVLKRTVNMILPEFEDIMEASSGVEALEVLAEKKVDIILTDINMEDMGGQELIAHVKADDTLKDIPIVVISTEGNQNRVAQLLEQGAVGYIKKPFTPEKIRDSLCEMFGDKNE